ncbi:MAG: hypothetical protein CO170_03870 [candidate division SR1 bacterium CG_4_9_14_3_um_filter_40_9]|nr:MAG: hypothetical protein CO170_03870 [candidate division SR1 bacterium CG_4_9_14_3_um_filter_40_9]
MKKIVLLGIITAYIVGLSSLAQFEVPGNATIYTEEQTQVINADDLSNPIREGAYKVINAEDNIPKNKVGGLVSADIEIETHDTAKLQTLSIIRNIINYALGLVSLVALIYLIYHGVLVLTAAGDETQYKRGIKGIQFAAIAIAGIGLSRLIVSFVFYIIQGAINGF